MMYVNEVTIIGKVCNKPELRFTKTEIPVTNFTVQTINTWIDQKTNEKKIDVKRHKITCWGNIAKKAVKILDVNYIVYVKGELSYHDVKQDDGTVTTNTEIKAVDIQSGKLEYLKQIIKDDVKSN